jgi:Flp pilus assembly protein TadG
MSKHWWRHATGPVRSIQSLRPRSRGQALVELAIILPVLLLLFMATLDLGRLFYSSITLSNAAREGAMEASVNPDSWVAGGACDKATNRIMCRAVNEATGSFVTVAPAGVSRWCTPDCSPALGTTVTVRVEGTFTLITPLMAVFTGGQNVTLASEATAQIATPPVGGVASTPTPSPTPTPTPAPTPTPTPDPSPTGSPGPTATPTAAPTPTPTPQCFVPNADFSVSPTVGDRRKNNSPGTTFTFTDSSTNMIAGCNPIWSWNFGDGSGSSSFQNPTYIYGTASHPHQFTITLVVSNNAGQDTHTAQVTVRN